MIRSKADRRSCFLRLIAQYVMHTWVSKMQKNFFICITLSLAQPEQGISVTCQSHKDGVALQPASNCKVVKASDLDPINFMNASNSTTNSKT
jgi:hypothetical protein